MPSPTQRGPDDFALRGAMMIAVFIVDAIKRNGRCTLALAGGETPRPIYAKLADREKFAMIEWPRVEIFFGDERGVPPTDAASNYRGAKEALLDHVPIPPDRVHRMEAERPDRDAAADEYAAVLPERLDILLLGMGADGHVASLFPHDPALEETRRLVVPVTAPVPPFPRLTITPPVLANAGATILLIGGRTKAAALTTLLQGDADPRTLPAKLVRGGLTIVDEALSAVMVHPKR